MNVSLYQAASALNANQRWQEIAAENLASSGVPGYKKQQLSIGALQGGMIPKPGASFDKALDHYALPKADTSTSFQQGEMKFTGSSTDLAVEGKGFFEVAMPNGTTAYTRDGEFHFSSTGQLVTKEGFQVIMDGGIAQFDMKNPGPISISSTGEISQGSDKKGRIRLTDVSEPNLMTEISGGYFVAKNVGIKTSDSKATMKQGYVEASNANVITEMANMMSAMRGFEANQKIVQMQDERMGKAISELGNAS
ncbi:MAG: hypothetical protein JWN25_650 [Verrucomicrobiales bacterium]|nr:hypothetical protein [Verrucomicrobiales bacterium]